MITQTFSKGTVVALAAMFVAPAWACFPPPDFKPTHEISLIELSQDPSAPAVVFMSEGFAVHVTADDLLAELAKEYMAVRTPNDLSNALRSRMPLVENLQVPDLIAAVFPAPVPGAAEEIQSNHRGSVMQAGHKFRYAFANALKKGRAVVIEPTTQSALPRIKLDTFKEICSGGRLFMTADGTHILQIVDWIS